MKKQFITKGLAGVLTVVLLAGIFPGAGSSSVKAQAAGSEPEVRNINLNIKQGDGSYRIVGITDPTPAPADWDISYPWEGSRVYFGSYGDRALLFRVLDADTTMYNANHTMFLDCEMMLEKMKYYPQDYWNDWEGSYLKEWMNSNAESGFTDCDDREIPGMLHTFTAVEQAAIALSTKETEEGIDGYGWPLYLDWCPLKNDRIFPLDAKEITYPPYGYSSTNSPAENRMKMGEEGSCYWLRSDDFEEVDNYCVGVIQDWNGRISHIHVACTVLWASPAFNLDLSTVLLASASGTNKTSDIAKVGTDGVAANTWELTLLDKDKTVAVTSGKSAVISGSTITVPYTYTGTDISQISVMITDRAYNSEDATVLYYGRLDTKSTFSGAEGNGKGTFRLPEGLPETAKIYILAEDVNSDNYVDYASAPILIEHIEEAAVSGIGSNLLITGAIVLIILAAGSAVVILNKKKNDNKTEAK